MVQGVEASQSYSLVGRLFLHRPQWRKRFGRGGELERVQADQIEIAAPLPQERLLQVNEALDELEREAPDAAQVVKLRYFAGLTQEQVAEAMGISLRTAERHWTWAKAWLFERIRQQEES